MKRKAVIPGSFDPITTGHLSLISRTAELFDEVTVLVCVNYDKTYMFSEEERFELVRLSVSELENVSVEIYGGWLYEYLNSHKPCVLVKGVRDEKDFVYERRMAEFNFEKSSVETLLLFSGGDEISTSSTKVRQLLESGGDWKKIIPQNAQKILKKFYAEK